MRVKFCFLHFRLSKSLSKWKTHAGRVTQTMPPQTSPAPHVCTEESCCYSCMLEMLLVHTRMWHCGTVGHISQILPSKWCRALGRCAATHSSAGPPCVTDPAQKQLHCTPMGTEQPQPQLWPHTSTAWPGVQKSSKSMIPALTSAKPSPSCTWGCERDKH